MEISIVIPTLNEADYIEQTIVGALATGARDIIVSDGGSTDRTVELARRYCRTISSPRGRARQMNGGALMTTGDVLLFLHADTLLPQNGLAAVQKALSDPRCVGGCFRLRFDNPSRVLRMYGALTALPMKSLCFGDRAHFVRRSIYEAVGGFPPIPVFEDLEMVKRLSEVGGFRVLRESVTTSARRFAAEGVIRRQFFNVMLWTRYRLGASPHRLSRHYAYPEPL